MDRRVLQAMQLLQEAARLDLLAADAARRARPARRAASGVAAAVAACSPPRGRRGHQALQVSRFGARAGPGRVLRRDHLAAKGKRCAEAAPLGDAAARAPGSRASKGWAWGGPATMAHRVLGWWPRPSGRGSLWFTHREKKKAEERQAYQPWEVRPQRAVPRKQRGRLGLGRQKKRAQALPFHGGTRKKRA
ncbi:hypothetical protein NDU88_003068 [Pleurodeles waltl]|uniref:Uncharacterized protein n=1 Tax=Pleurodeles waltl TaxID=8319 RepID=A0AAV7T3Z8_PLEWA|nr:hypothetical protein NDU88_003068 [Pleurodeles waltl]